VAALLKSDQETVVCAALCALTKIGNVDHVPALFALTSRDGAVGRAATDALSDLRAPDTGRALIALTEKDPAQQTRVLAILSERSESTLLPKLEPFLKSAQADVRKEAWIAIGKTASDAALGQLVAWLPLAQDAEQNQAEAAIRSVAKNAESAARVATFAAAWKSAPIPAKKVLANLMPGYADPAFVAPLTGALTDPDKDLRETALRALADWPTLEPYAALKDAINAQTDSGLKTVALRCALKLATANAGAETCARCIELFKVAPDDKGRMTVADTLFKHEGLELFPALQELSKDPACGATAKKAYVSFFDQKLKQQAGQALRDMDPKKWKANASHAGHDATHAFDRNPDTRWSSNTPSVKGMWFTLDLGENAFISEVVLDTEKSGGDTPNGYEVFASNDGKTWTGPVAQGNGNSRGKTVIPLAVQTRHLKFITTDGRKGLHWSIHELYVKTGLDQKKVAEIGKIADTLR
jgi:HEAT repeat protein